ncbi:MAG: hypothetical protein ACKVU2_02420 [Saprospiraceae bacterium]
MFRIVCTLFLTIPFCYAISRPVHFAPAWYLERLPAGVYVYRVRSESGGVGAGRVVKE